MKLKEKMHLCLASDNGYFVGLAVAVTSACASTASHDLYFHILDGGICEIDKNDLERRVLAYNSANKVIFYPFDQSCLNGYRVGAGHSYMAYARLFMPAMLDLDKVIYLDCDIILLKDLEELWNIEMGEYGIAACADEIIKKLSQDYPFEKEFVDAAYFNSGVMVINLEYWREERILDKTLDLINQAPEKFKFWDQTALNVLFNGNIKWLERRWNTIAKSIDIASDDVAILHFLTGPKPWKVPPENTHDMFWLESAKLLTEFKREKNNVLSKEGLRIWKDNKVISSAFPYFLQCQLLFFKRIMGGNLQVINGRFENYAQRRLAFKEMRKMRGTLRAFAQQLFCDE